MKLAYVTTSGRGRIDDLVAEVVRALSDDGLRIAGTVRVKPADPSGHPCDMDLRVLPDGPSFRISQPLGSGAKGCRLDGGVIEAIAVEVEARLTGADLLVVNKYGKLEAQGRGLATAVAMASEMMIPTLVGVNEMNAPDFLAFSDGDAVPVLPEVPSVLDWYRTVASGALGGRHSSSGPDKLSGQARRTSLGDLG